MTTFEPVALDDFLLRFFPREYVSASSLKMYVRCPEQWRRRYVLGHKAPPNSNMLWGGADHKAIEFSYKQKLTTEKDLPVEEVKERFVHELETRIDEEGGAGEVEWSGRDLEGKTPEQATTFVKNRGANLVAAYQEQVAPITFPLTVEQEFLLPIDGLSIPIKGYVDLTAHRSRPEDPLFTAPHAPYQSPRFAVERKTKATNQPPAPDDRFQAHLYEYATGLPVEFQVSVKSAQPKVTIHEPQPLEPRERTAASLKRLVLGIATCFSLYGEEQPWPDHGRLHMFACGTAEKPQCGFRSSCPYWHEEYWPK